MEKVQTLTEVKVGFIVWENGNLPTLVTYLVTPEGEVLILRRYSNN